MGKVYKIHPGMGFARVGRSGQGYFLSGETPGAGPIDIDAAGKEAPFAGYKDAAHLMRRQGARFRVYEYERDDATGKLDFRREITADDAAIKWSVSLVSAKAEGRLMTAMTGPDGKRTIVPSKDNRNEPPTGFTRKDLKASVDLTATGRNDGPAPGSETLGKIVGKDLFIGEARTDSAGRLIVLAGWGHAASWETPPKATSDFLNNATWYDDIADGSVDATITFDGQAPVNAAGAWVFTAPPDFAPDNYPVTSLFDIAEQASNVPLPQMLTYPQDIAPILQRAADLSQVNTKSGWNAVHNNLTTLPNLGSPDQAAAANRKTVLNNFKAAVSQMNDYSPTARQLNMLDAWANGAFAEQAQARAALSPAEALDRASLEHCVGGGFFPGIEAGTILRQPTIYAELGRLKRGTFTDFDGNVLELTPGLISARMACPWQADFTECEGAWWPAQRPDVTGRNAAGAAGPKWHRGIVVNDDSEDPQSHANMIDHFAQLGVIVKSDAGFTEVGRDPGLPASA